MLPAHKNLVVMDRCVLLQRPELYLCDDDGILIPDAVGSEIAHGDRSDRESTVFWRWIEGHGRRVYLGTYWWDVAAYECSVKKVAGLRQIVQWPLTNQIRKVEGTVPTRAERLQALPGSDSERGYEWGRERFLELCRDFRDWIEAAQREWWNKLSGGTSSQAERVRWICDPLSAAAMAGTVAERFGMSADADRYRSDPWQKALAQFPDSRAIGRWTRIILWYMVKWAAGETSGFENNWDDAHYAFAASYTGHIATEDGGLRTMVQTLFPDCRIREPRR
jgi:hypothetical protein